MPWVIRHGLRAGRRDVTAECSDAVGVFITVRERRRRRRRAGHESEVEKEEGIDEEIHGAVPVGIGRGEARGQGATEDEPGIEHVEGVHEGIEVTVAVGVPADEGGRRWRRIAQVGRGVDAAGGVSLHVSVG